MRTPKPTRDGLLVELIHEEKTSHGIFIPTDYLGRAAQRAKVLAVGEGHVDKGELIPIGVSVGDIVVFKADSATDCGQYHHITESMIYGTLRDEFTPHWDKVLIVRDSGETVTKGGLVLQEHEEGYERGTVVAVGAGYPTRHGVIRSELQAGDRVLFSRYEGEEITLSAQDARELYIARDMQVYAKIGE